MRLPCLASRENSRKSGWIMGIRFTLPTASESSIDSFQFTEKRDLLLHHFGPAGRIHRPAAFCKEGATALQSSKKGPSLPMVVQDKHSSPSVRLTITGIAPPCVCLFPVGGQSGFADSNGSGSAIPEWAKDCRKMDRRRQLWAVCPIWWMRAYVTSKEAGFPEPVSVRVRFLLI